MKRVLCVVMILALMFALGISSLATDTQTIMLSELSDEECIAFLKESGVEIPDDFGNDMAWMLFIKHAAGIWAGGSFTE